ncbi:G5 domain-containing protein [Microbacterium sp.]|uniref:G5 domain-containing protein n=1 Tax=Microbacterium sp. TaxID=51671 RepID=UPI003A956DED
MPELPLASWHLDPENPNQFRWWDGTQWTNITAPLNQATASEPITSHAKRKKAWLVVAFIVGALLIGAVLAKWSPVIAILAVLAVVGLAIVAIAGRPMPRLGLGSRRAGFTALGTAAMLVLGAGISSASVNEPTSPAALVAPAVIESPTSRPTPTPNPTTFTTVSEESPIPFGKTTIDDPQLDRGNTTVTTIGANGIMVTKYRVTLVDGKEVAREAIAETVRLEPVAEVTTVGSRVPPPPPPAPAAPVPLVQQNGGCDSNYADACVPIASDVDCAGGSGNGPAYVQGPVRIVGSDIYDLDRDGDGIACD